MKDKKNGIEITEIFMANPYGDFSRCFYGTIKRETDSSGHQVVYAKIKVLNGYVYAMASDQLELGKRLDLLVLMVLEMGLHSDSGKSIPNGNISLN